MNRKQTPEYKAEQKVRHARWYKANKERVLELNRKWLKRNPEKKQAQRERYWLVETPESKAKRNERSKKWYHGNLEQARKYNREAMRAKFAAMTPEQRKERKLMENFGMTYAEWMTMFESQGCACAICRTTEPGTKTGWNTDHCHTSGKVRFILCAHCNRGLGAFRDNPALLRAAADILEAFQTAAEFDLANWIARAEEDRPVSARHEAS